MEENFNQIFGYFETVPLWPFILLGFVGVVAIMVDVVNRKRRAMAIENFRATIAREFADMYPQHKRWPQNVNAYLIARLPEMYQNFEVLRGFIPQDRLLSYNTDWNNFRDFCRDLTDEKCVAIEQSGGVNQESDPKTVLHELLTKLLQYTEL